MSSRRIQVAVPVHELELFFLRDADQRSCPSTEVPCCVTGFLDAEWHHLNREPSDNSLSNFVRLSSTLNAKLSGKNSIFQKPRSEHGERDLPPELKYCFLISEAAKHFSKWMDTDAYACAQLAYWIADWEGKYEQRFEALIFVLRYARHAFHPQILQQVLRRQLLPLIQPSLGDTQKAQILMELTGLYAWIGCAKEAKAMALQLKHMISSASGLYDKRKRRIAQCIAVVSPESSEARGMLEESAEAAMEVDEKADVAASKSTTALVTVDARQLKISFDSLRRRLTESEKHYGPIAVRPLQMTINNAIGEMFYLGLMSLHFNEKDTAKEAVDRLETLIHPDSKTHRFISPPTWKDCWIPVLQTAHASGARDRMISLLMQATPSEASYGELIVSLGEVAKALARIA